MASSPSSGAKKKGAPPQDMQSLGSVSQLTDPLELRRSFEKARDDTSRMTLRARQSGRQFEAKFAAFDGKAGTFDVKIDDPASISGFEEETREAPETLALIFLRSALLLGVPTKFLGYVQMAETFAIARFEVPPQILRIQRRKDARYTIARGYDIKVTLPALEGERRRVQKQLLDVSAGGISFYVLSPREANLYQEGLILRNITFHVFRHEVSADGEIRNRVPFERVPGERGTRVGVKFTRVSAEDSDFIASYVAAQLLHIRE